MEKEYISLSMLRDIVGEGDLHILLSSKYLNSLGLDLSHYIVLSDSEYFEYLLDNPKD